MMLGTAPSVRSYTSPCAAANLIPRRLSSVRRPNPARQILPRTCTIQRHQPIIRPRASTVLKSVRFPQPFLC